MLEVFKVLRTYFVYRIIGTNVILITLKYSNSIPITISKVNMFYFATYLYLHLLINCSVPNFFPQIKLFNINYNI